MNNETFMFNFLCGIFVSILLVSIVLVYIKAKSFSRWIMELYFHIIPWTYNSVVECIVFSVVRAGSVGDFLGNYNAGQNIWKKLQKSKKIRQEQKTLIFARELFLTAVAKKSFLEGWLDTGFCLTQFWDFSNVFNYPRIDGSTMKKFVTVDIKSSFTWGESNLYWNTVNC